MSKINRVYWNAKDGGKIRLLFERIAHPDRSVIGPVVQTRINLAEDILDASDAEMQTIT